MQSFLKKALAAVAAVVSAGWLSADQITLTDQSVIRGTVKSIQGGKAVVKTDFAGELTISQDKILKITTDSAVTVVRKEKPAEKVNGTITAPAGTQQINAVALPMADIAYLWAAGMPDPTLPKPPEGRKWSGEASLDIVGKTGNSEKFNGGAGVKATLAGPVDKLLLYASANYERENSVTSKKKYLAGADYEHKIAETKNSWYARVEFEQQTTSGLRLREEAGVGYGYYFIDDARTQLRARVGLTAKSRKFVDGSHNDSMGAEAALHFEQKIDEWGKWVTDLTYQPTLENFHDYRILHESSLEIPMLMKKPLSLRLGVSNEYNSRVAEGLERLETNYFVKLVYAWK